MRMPLMSEHITNYNLALENLYKIEVPSAPHFNYFIQSCELPAISMAAIDVTNRHHQAFVAGNKVEYSPLSCTFLLDEDFENYVFLHNWLRSFIDERPWQDIVKDTKLTILTANKIPLLEFNFVQAFPTQIGSLSFNSTTSENNQITYSCEFAYQHFTFTRFS